MNLNIPIRLKELRESQGWSQQEVADKLGIERTTYVKYESGASKPTRKLQDIAALYNVSTDYILKGAVASYSETLPEGTFSKLVLEEALKTDEGKEHLQKLIEDHVINPLPPENKKIPIIGSVRCGPNGLAYQYLEGYVLVGEEFKGDIVAFRCTGDSMKDIGITDGDLAIVRLQEDVECGELAVVTINGDEGTLKRVRKFEHGIILEAANQEYPPRIFTGSELELIRIVGKVLEVRKKF